MPAKTFALESSSRTVRRCKLLIDAAVHEYLDSASDDKCRRLFIQLVSVVRTNSCILQPAYVAGPKGYSRVKYTLDVLMKLTHVKCRWQDDPWMWTSKEISYSSALCSLIKFLLVRNKVPQFLYMGWLSGYEDGAPWSRFQTLFFHIANGNSVRGFSVHGGKLTKSMAKRFMNSPAHLCLAEAFEFACNKEYSQCSPKPNLLISRRRRKAICADVSHSEQSWDPLPFSGFRTIDDDDHRPWSCRVWTIKQIVDRGQLRAEGRRMNHCVANYAELCESGRTSIWTMERHGAMTSLPAITIQVEADGEIVTALGRRNRNASLRELEVISMWAKRERLHFSARLKASLDRLRHQRLIGSQ